MHSGVAKWVAFSGEFFVHRIREVGAVPERAESLQEQEHDHVHGEAQERDPARYKLVIDNDSGAYLPNKAQLPELHTFLTSPLNLCALEKVGVKDGFDEELKGWKERQVRGRDGSGEDWREAGEGEGKMLQHHGSLVKVRVQGQVMRWGEQMAEEHEREEAGSADYTLWDGNVFV
ncbi:hypothetical protein CALVIDRAFT_568674 [Calocera viscosa TUFC12733]|uniref:Uncharacterized protein n=1 Tax=Calocera viscosa (strain TUFC12733) TaxID=1330018 RepID=A0A167GTF9_CALVF|nr:hypothetical protein CALVIDRAFT_568674 [Calocera viscosa TUFC12733]